MEIHSTENIKQKEKIHVCLYGASGTGKTKMIETLPGKTLVLNADKGLLTLKGSANVDYVEVNDFENVIEFMQFIQKGEIGYDNVVIDSISSVADYLHKFLERKGLKGFDIWREYANYIKSIITTLRDSTSFNSVSIFELVEKENEMGMLAKRIGLQGSLASRVPYFYDFFLAARVKNTKDGATYKIQTSTQDGFECRARQEGLPVFLDPDLGALFNIIKGEV